jgi:asparagine N-glycosylation enzyme membrane subunit Stt3
MKLSSSSWFVPVLVFAAFMIGMASIEFATPDLPDNDGFYHIKFASLMREEGLKPKFNWLPLTILNEKDFYDHHFLFHAALIPFTFGDLRLGAKWAAVIFASLAFLAVWFLFRRQKIPHAWLWAAALLGISDAFLYRMSVTRAQSLSLAVLALAFVLLLENKHKHLAVLSFVFVWMYNAFPLILALAALHFLAVAMVERRFEFRPLLFVSGGIAVGSIINLYFPQNIIFSYNHMLPKLMDATSVRVGNEWFPYETKQLLENSLPALIAFASGIFALGFSGKKMDVRTAFALLASLLFGVMLFQARRFVEYFPPFALIFAAFTWTPLFSLQVDPRSSRLAPSLLGLAVVLSITVSIPRAREAIRASKPYDLYAGASAWLEANTPAGARVFQTDWDDFPRLFFYNTHNTYLIGLDPTYMQLYDPNLYALWVEITKGNVDSPSQLILETFGARYVHTDLNHTGFLRAAREDEGLKEVYRDDQAVIFEVIVQP